ncbi:hypothetical protein SAMN04488109_2817 [Chryseolinea serpens]|uniref:DUF4304 domain-containing protein n=1 Tax=Chryseolinea serpens TaxID=947013 RepID=A0A1M5QI54_9BACT|nr:hypothetical protein [Chryseolinea serpens]SHH13480.1 hypothetical protein SAMN04488109_2817 [Chryseolinea serpens]
MINLEHIFDEAGFTCRQSKVGYITVYAFTRETAGRKEKIYITHRDYSTSQNPNNNKFETPWVRVTFQRVEQVIAEVAGLSPDDLGTIHQHAFLEVGLPGLVLDKRLFNVNSESEENIFAGYLKEFYDKGARPFFERYTTLESVDEQISALPDEQLQSFITDSGGNMALHRALVIKVLTRNPGTIDYLSTWKKILFEDINDSTVKRMYDLLLKFADKLQIQE